jgi:hypothetical protein
MEELEAVEGVAGDPRALDLPGPSRRITVEPIRLPEPARRSEPAPPPEPAPQPQPKPERAPEPERQPA